MDIVQKLQMLVIAETAQVLLIKRRHNNDTLELVHLNNKFIILKMRNTF